MSSIYRLIRNANKREMLGQHLDEMSSVSIDRKKFPTIQLFQDLREEESKLRKEFYNSVVLMAWGTQVLREVSIQEKKQSPVHVISKEHTARKVNVAKGKAERGITELLNESIEHTLEGHHTNNFSEEVEHKLGSIRNALQRFPVRTSIMLKISNELLSPNDPAGFCASMIEYLHALDRDVSSEPYGITEVVYSRAGKAKELLQHLAEAVEGVPDNTLYSDVTPILGKVRSPLEDIKELSGTDRQLSTKELIFLSRIQFALEAGALSTVFGVSRLSPALSTESYQKNRETLLESTDRCLEFKQLIVGSHWRLALSQAKKFWPRGVGAGLGPSDVLSISYSGLLAAIEKFDPSLGLQFSTYAGSYMEGFLRTNINRYKYETANADNGRRAAALSRALWKERVKRCVKPPLDSIAFVRGLGKDEELREQLQQTRKQQPFVIAHLPENPDGENQFEELSGPLGWEECRKELGLSDPKVKVIPLEPELYEALWESPLPEGKYIASGGAELRGEIGLLQLMGPRQVDQIMRVGRTVLSLDQPHPYDDRLHSRQHKVLKSDEEGGVGRLTPSHLLREMLEASVEDPADSVMERELYEGESSVLGKLLAELPDRYQQAVRLRFGIDCDHRHTLQEVAKEMGISRERVRQIEERSIELLKEQAQKAKYKDLLDREKPQLF